MRALVLHHDANSTSGLVGAALRDRGHDLVEHYVCDRLDSPEPARPLPTLDGVDLLVALGSRWSVYDSDAIGAWIDDELDLLREAHRGGVPTLGICFGAQALAAAHGAEVRVAARPEVGWCDVDSDVPALADGPWFQWHLDVFDVPHGGELLASSPSGPQVFRLGRQFALQFHPELDRALLELWMVNDRDQLHDAGIDPDALVAETVDRQASARDRCGALIDWFLGEIAPVRTAFFAQGGP